MTYAGDSISGAAAAYNDAQARRGVAEDNAFNEMLRLRENSRNRALQIAQLKTQADQFNDEFAFRKSEALRSAIQQRIQNDFEQQRINLSKDQNDSGLSPAESRRLNLQAREHDGKFQLAADKASQGGYADNSEVLNDLPDASQQEVENLLRNSLQYRDAVQKHNEEVSGVAEKINQVSDQQRRLQGFRASLQQPTVTTSGRRPQSLSGYNPFGDNYGFGGGTANSTIPADSPLISRQAAFAASLSQQAEKLAPYLNPKAGYVTPDPISGKVKPILISAPWKQSESQSDSTKPEEVAAPPNLPDGTVIRQKSTGKLFRVQGGKLVPNT